MIATHPPHRQAAGILAPDTTPAPRPVYCVIDRLYRRRGVADAACRGEFTYGGHSLTLGLDPDWRSPLLPEDDEWRIEWWKFYEGLDLADAFAATGDERYRAAWERLVSSWLARMPGGVDTSDVAARRVQNWIYAWQRFASCPDVRWGAPDFPTRLVAGIAAHAAQLREHLTPARNHRTLELYALFIVALAVPSLDPRGALLAESMAGLHRNLLDDLLPDGVQRECSTHYHMLVLRSFLGARENARRHGLAFPASYDERLARACEFALHCHRPDGTIPAVSDSDTGSYGDLLLLAGSLLSRPDFVYAATRGALGNPPHETAASFPDGGYYVQRSGWGVGSTSFRDERFLLFDCGPLGDGGHGHYDALHVDIAANGRPLVVDPGRFTYAEGDPNWRAWFKGTAAHNTVAVDGLDQTPYRRGRPKGGTATTTLIRRATSSSLDVLVGECASPAYDAVHRRRVVFVHGDYWVVEDELTSDAPHRYDLRYHLTPDAALASVVPCCGGLAVVAPHVALLFPEDLAPAIEPGWVSPTYGEKLAAPVVSVVRQATGTVRVLTVVLPRRASEALPQILRYDTNDEGVTTLSLERMTRAARVRDVLSWTRDGDDHVARTEARE